MSRALVFLCFLMFMGIFGANAISAQLPVVFSRSDFSEPGKLYSEAMAIAQKIDRGQAAQVWDAASIALRKTVKRDVFVENIGRVRGSLGAAGGREWILVVRQQAREQGFPQGKYVTVELLSIFSGDRKVKELVSFRQDEDGDWRFNDYSLRVFSE